MKDTRKSVLIRMDKDTLKLVNQAAIKWCYENQSDRRTKPNMKMNKARAWDLLLVIVMAGSAVYILVGLAEFFGR